MSLAFPPRTRNCPAPVKTPSSQLFRNSLCRLPCAPRPRARWGTGSALSRSPPRPAPPHSLVGHRPALPRRRGRAQRRRQPEQSQRERRAPVRSARPGARHPPLAEVPAAPGAPASAWRARRRDETAKRGRRLGRVTSGRVTPPPSGSRRSASAPPRVRRTLKKRCPPGRSLDTGVASLTPTRWMCVTPLAQRCFPPTLHPPPAKP